MGGTNAAQQVPTLFQLCSVGCLSPWPWLFHSPWEILRFLAPTVLCTQLFTVYRVRTTMKEKPVTRCVMSLAGGPRRAGLWAQDLCHQEGRGFLLASRALAEVEAGRASGAPGGRGSSCVCLLGQRGVLRSAQAARSPGTGLPLPSAVPGLGTQSAHHSNVWDEWRRESMSNPSAS